MKTFLKTVFLTLAFYSCAFDPKQKIVIESILSVENKTNDTLYLYISNHNSLENISETVLNTDELFTNDICYNYPDSSSRIKYRLLPKLTTYFYGNKKWLPYKTTDSIYFYIIKENNLKRYKWEEITCKQMFETKLKYSFEEIENKYLKIIYNK